MMNISDDISSSKDSRLRSYLWLGIPSLLAFSQHVLVDMHHLFSSLNDLEARLGRDYCSHSEEKKIENHRRWVHFAQDRSWSQDRVRLRIELARLPTAGSFHRLTQPLRIPMTSVWSTSETCGKHVQT